MLEKIWREIVNERKILPIQKAKFYRDGDENFIAFVNISPTNGYARQMMGRIQTTRLNRYIHTLYSDRVTS